MPVNTDLVNHALTGERRALSRLISIVEDGGPDARFVIAAIHPHTGHAHIVGVTGAPGTGKSTLVTELAKAYRRRGLTVGIVAVDPTSPFSGGALLGDRIRMRDLSGDAGIFIRSMATRGSLGGLAATTAEVVKVLDAAGFGLVIVETVGAGQSEVEIASTAHTTLVLEVPGLGDDVQAIKAGILEIADIFVVNKADYPGADNVVHALNMMLDLTNTTPAASAHHGWDAMAHGAATNAKPTAWRPPIVKTIAVQGEGIEELVEVIERHRAYLHDSGEFMRRERQRIAAEFNHALRANLIESFLQRVPERALSEMLDRIIARQVDEYTAVEELLAQYGIR
ncbi:MAG: methylmalonyl Co-A mutase-associated GTPase MeaB [Chloroflexi bacterium]|nr:methylmalonyl Co-A mutase-associated GTPase MeaB [Chloroflexota bacterium]